MKKPFRCMAAMPVADDDRPGRLIAGDDFESPGPRGIPVRACSDRERAAVRTGA